MPAVQSHPLLDFAPKHSLKKFSSPLSLSARRSIGPHLHCSTFFTFFLKFKSTTLKGFNPATIQGEVPRSLTEVIDRSSDWLDGVQMSGLELEFICRTIVSIRPTVRVRANSSRAKIQNERYFKRYLRQMLPNMAICRLVSLSYIFSGHLRKQTPWYKKPALNVFQVFSTSWLLAELPKTFQCWNGLNSSLPVLMLSSTDN